MGSMSGLVPPKLSSDLDCFAVYGPRIVLVALGWTLNPNASRNQVIIYHNDALHLAFEAKWSIFKQQRFLLPLQILLLFVTTFNFITKEVTKRNKIEGGNKK